MATLLRDASAARLLLDLTALSVKWPRRPPRREKSNCVGGEFHRPPDMREF